MSSFSLTLTVAKCHFSSGIDGKETEGQQVAARKINDETDATNTEPKRSETEWFLVAFAVTVWAKIHSSASWGVWLSSYGCKSPRKMVPNLSECVVVGSCSTLSL